jgi:hypothetical protein
MTDTPQPTSGSLEARIIRKCPTHRDCPLTCKQRPVEELGMIASFGEASVPASIVQRLKEGFRKWHL